MALVKFNLQDYKHTEWKYIVLFVICCTGCQEWTWTET